MQDGKTKYLSNDVLHVPNITRNVVLAGQMVKKGWQVKFNLDGYFVEDMKNQYCLFVEGNKKDRMFSLDADMHAVGAAMFTHGRGVIADIEIWPKHIGHVTMQRLKSMQMQIVVAGVFKVNGMQKVCEACQMGKQARHAFSQNDEVSDRALEVIHSDAWRTKASSLSGCHYYVSFIDDHTKKVWVYFMKYKSKVFSHYKDSLRAWKFMTANFLMGKGVWILINGDEQELVLLQS